MICRSGYKLASSSKGHFYLMCDCRLGLVGRERDKKEDVWIWICSLHRLLGHMQKHNNCAVHNLSSRRPCLRYEAQLRQYVYVHQSVAVIGCKPKLFSTPTLLSTPLAMLNLQTQWEKRQKPSSYLWEKADCIRWSAYYCYRKSSVYGGVHVYASLPVSMIRLLFNKVNFYAL